MVFGNGVKNMQATAYNGARTVCSTFVKFNWTYFRTSTLQCELNGLFFLRSEFSIDWEF